MWRGQTGISGKRSQSDALTIGCWAKAAQSQHIDELREKAGDLVLLDSVAYCAQEPWILTGTIGENSVSGDDAVHAWIPATPGEKVGVVGRTGSGKSTLMTALFRIMEASKGSIAIDGIDIASLGLKTLRSRLQIIPQEPVLFRGTVRSNLDFATKYSDDDLWAALDLVGLKDFVGSLDGKLDAAIEENGANLSMGQRQLMCLCKAILAKPKVLIMDEATASVDAEADKRIQESIETQFAATTVLSIAHRLNTIAAFDRVLVLDGGRIAEFDAPHVLLGRAGSVFGDMVDATGAANAAVFSCKPTSGRSAYTIPPLDRLLRFRIIVSTCCAAASLAGVGVPGDHFSHIFVDEAGQALEPEIMIALNTFAQPTTANVVLAGDHKQLGPILHSRLAKHFGLGVSLLERLMGYIAPHDIAYPDRVRKRHHPRLRVSDVGAQRDEYAAAVSVLSVKLLNNFRSHGDILHVPNGMFYGGELRECADRLVTCQYLSWPELPNCETPLLFHHVDGKDEREGSSPSWFNVAEIQIVSGLVQQLRDSRHGFKPITNDDIGIISPYNRQCMKLRKVLAAKGFERVNVGNVEVFQGQERKVIIISTVRSNPDHLSHDARFNLGFLSDPKRFNVAVTRAKALLIVVGNAHILVKDPSWRAWIRHALKLGGVRNLPVTVRDLLELEMNGGGIGGAADQDGFLEEFSALRIGSEGEGSRFRLTSMAIMAGNFIAQGETCPRGDACGFSHVVLPCSTCNVFCTSLASLVSHTKSRKHKAAEERREKMNDLLGGAAAASAAASDSAAAASAASERGGNGDGGDSADAAPKSKSAVDRALAACAVQVLSCAVCLLTFTSTETQTFHFSTFEHKRKERVAGFVSVEKDRQSAKHGIELPTAEEFDAGFVELRSSASGSARGFTTTVAIANTNTSGPPVDVLEPLINNMTPTCVQVSWPDGQFPGSVASGNHLEIKFRFSPSHVGYANVRIDFRFRARGTDFQISRTFKAFIGDKQLYELSRASQPFVRRTKAAVQRLSDQQFVAAPQLDMDPDAVKWVSKLGFFDVPDDMRACVHKRENDKVMRTEDEFERLFLPYGRDIYLPGGYLKFFSSLLWAEEIQMDIDIKEYSLAGATMQRLPSGLYALRVEGLAENRPSVVRGDTVLVRKAGSQTAFCFQGRAATVTLDEVHLAFDRKFDQTFVQGMKFDVEFSYGRIPVRRMHSAVSAPMRIISNFDLDFDKINVAKMAAESADKLAQARAFKFHPFNRLVADNEEQNRAVSIITLGLHAPFPFLLFGPPGTGKTVTLVESIKQIFSRDRNSRILVCAPSNSAADLLLERLATTVGRADMFRLNALERSQPSSFTGLDEFSCKPTSGRSAYTIPPLDRLLRFRIIVSTCCAAASLAGVGVPGDHFSHIFVDEAGQALEPEIMIALNTFAQPTTANVVLAGDHKQLGPILHSRLAKHFGLGVSLLERLMGYIAPHDIAYPDRVRKRHHPRLRVSDVGAQRDEYAAAVSVLSVKLLNNFRSHGDILHVPNGMFYGGELRECADRLVTCQYLSWPELPNCETPLLFHHVDGKDEREGSSPSWFNVAEIQIVSGLVQQLRDSRHGFKPITNDDIGIISPYNRQCMKLRKVLAAKGFERVNVGNVEVFQGQERKVIIISTVRSNPDHLSHDARFNLGFLSDPKRFNVAVTRAKALLIVVGNAHILVKDPSWRAWIRHALKLGACKNLPQSIRDDLEDKGSGGAPGAATTIADEDEYEVLSDISEEFVDVGAANHEAGWRIYE
ncbi:hypothetical protein HK105_208267 [Polyrhizophydium stewartii]|uniref:RNA helicase n=1 Tax=Polyrhizophydium stewartii TaxID=2732419 RepID=A0ABR4MYD2_9FUNG